jgi:hypothetical protein
VFVYLLYILDTRASYALSRKLVILINLRYGID